MRTILLAAWLFGSPPSIDFIREHAITFSQPDGLPTAVETTLSKYRVIAVGEIHGSDEAPRFVHGLLSLLTARGKSVLLGLEVPAEEQPFIDKYLKTGDLAILRESPFFRRKFQDGRSSRAMARLLGEIRALPNVRVFGFDAVDIIDGQDRDERMARNLAAEYRKQPADHVVFLAGNLHASLAKGNQFDPSYRSMGYELVHGTFEESETLAIKVRNELGETWCCLGTTVADCKTHPMEFGKSNYSDALSSDYYFLEEGSEYEGYRATFFARKLTASLPLGG